MDDTIHVLIADDHQLFRDGLRALLLAAPDMDVVGEACSGLEAVELAADTQTSVILMDIQMPGLDGIEATRAIVAANPSINVLMVTMFEDDQSVFAAMRAGAKGYVLKGSKHDEMLRAIRTVNGGGAIFSPDIASRMMNFFTASRASASLETFSDLTNREYEILTLIARGESNAGIAESLSISVKTVRNHVSNIFNKLQVADRVQAALRARDAGLG